MPSRLSFRTCSLRVAARLPSAQTRGCGPTHWASLLHPHPPPHLSRRLFLFLAVIAHLVYGVPVGRLGPERRQRHGDALVCRARRYSHLSNRATAMWRLRHPSEAGFSPSRRKWRELEAENRLAPKKGCTRKDLRFKRIASAKIPPWPVLDMPSPTPNIF